MKTKMKCISFYLKKRSDLYEDRTCNPYKYPKSNKTTFCVRKVICNYKKIVAKNCRTNDIQKFMKTDPLFPLNSEEFLNLLIEITENATSFFNSFSLTSGSNRFLRTLRLAYFPIQENYATIQTLLCNELEGSHSSDIKIQAKTLRMNLVSLIQIREDINNIAENWITSHVVMEDLRNYLNNLRTICSFIYLIILKKKSTVVNKMLQTQTVSNSSSEHHICSLCGQMEAVCSCFSDLASTSYRNYNEDDDDFSPEDDKNDDIENTPHCSTSAGHAEMEDAELEDAELDDADFWQQYLEHYESDDQKLRLDSQESSSDTD